MPSRTSPLPQVFAWRKVLNVPRQMGVYGQPEERRRIWDVQLEVLKKEEISLLSCPDRQYLTETGIFRIAERLRPPFGRAAG